MLDTINAYKGAGTVIELKRDQIPLYKGIKLSDHQVTFQKVLGLANFRGHVLPQLQMVGANTALYQAKAEGHNRLVVAQVSGA